MASPAREFDDIQAILRSGLGPLEGARFLLLRVRDAAAAKAWLAAVSREPGATPLTYHVTSAADLKTYQPRALQIAVTAQGLKRLGVAASVVAAFSREFCLTPGTGDDEREGRPRRLGDIGANAPAAWEWGTGAAIPDVLILLYAEAGAITGFMETVVADFDGGFEVMRTLAPAEVSASDEPRREPFGFVDGISQPDVDWEGTGASSSKPRLEYSNTIAAGEFLLGYLNEYGFYTARPLLDPGQDDNDVLAPAEDVPGKRDLGRNGTYLVLRQLEQDVAAFWRFASGQSPDDGGVRTAEAMLGRRFATGDPLVPAAAAPIRGVGPDEDDVRQNGFTFDADPDGLNCPYGAHIRRVNPRTADMPGGPQGLVSRLLRTVGLTVGEPREDTLSSSRFHRILRRGRPFGDVVGKGLAGERAAAGTTAPGSEKTARQHGLYFIALNANISRQFEFIQSAWVVHGRFNGLEGESDPILGNRLPSPSGEPTDRFSVPQASGVTQRIAGLPQFVTVRGGAYFFLPGLRGLRFIAQARGG